MPPYAGQGQAKWLRPGEQAFLFDNEPAVEGVASIAVALDRSRPAERGFAAQVFFSGNPGAFAVDMEAAELDQDDFYTTAGFGGWSTGFLNANNTARLDWAQYNRPATFVRAFIRLITNLVNVTIVVTR